MVTILNNHRNSADYQQVGLCEPQDYENVLNSDFVIEEFNDGKFSVTKNRAENFTLEDILHAHNLRYRYVNNNMMVCKPSFGVFDTFFRIFGADYHPLYAPFAYLCLEATLTNAFTVMGIQFIAPRTNVKWAKMAIQSEELLNLYNSSPNYQKLEAAFNVE